MEHQGTKILETNRLILRPFHNDDIESSFRHWTSDDRVTKYLRWPTHKNIDTTKSIISEWIENYKDPTFYQWAIVPKDLNEPIGTISVVDMNEKIDMVHIGYCIGSKWWHQGYTSEAFLRIIPFLFEEVKVNRIESMHDPLNPYSGKVMEKCGLIYEGTMRQADWNQSGIVDVCMYSLLAQDYFQHKK